jgi:hypothetical protein
MNLPRRSFLRLAAGAATLPELSGFAWGQAINEIAPSKNQKQRRQSGRYYAA